MRSQSDHPIVPRKELSPFHRIERSASNGLRMPDSNQDLFLTGSKGRSSKNHFRTLGALRNAVIRSNSCGSGQPSVTCSPERSDPDVLTSETTLSLVRNMVVPSD